jgi:hypothetical protein
MSMKRLLIILLLVIMPCQAVWAAACACCIGDEGKVVQQSSQALDQQQASGDDSGDDGDDAKPCCDSGCDACHHLAASAIPSANPDLPLPKGAPHLRGELRRYVSHIPDLIPPPDRPLRA